MVKTFKIGEYAVGGVIKATVKPYKGRIHCTINFQDYNTRENILTMQNQLGLSHSMEQVDSFLGAHLTLLRSEGI